MIEFPRDLYDEIITHANEGDGEEVCGVLGGTYGSTSSVVESVHRTANVADTPETRYAIDPETQYEITEQIESTGESVVGFYHSHPAGPATPSDTDADRATWPGYSYVIVALDGHPYVGAWRWSETDGFRGERVAIGDSAAPPEP
jgi:proteasome lid subunit RPN8/RPN11